MAKPFLRFFKNRTELDIVDDRRGVRSGQVGRHTSSRRSQSPSNNHNTIAVTGMASSGPAASNETPCPSSPRRMRRRVTVDRMGAELRFYGGVLDLRAGYAGLGAIGSYAFRAAEVPAARG